MLLERGERNNEKGGGTAHLLLYIFLRRWREIRKEEMERGRYYILQFYFPKCLDEDK